MMKKDKLHTISLLLPTRKRKKLVTRLFKSIIKNTANLGLIEVILYVDDDDKESQSITEPKLNIKKIIGPRKSMGACNTVCFMLSKGQIIMLINDDMIIRTKNWDEYIMNLHNIFNDRIYLAYGNDLMKKSNLCTFPIISRKFCNLIKYPFPIEYKGAFIDTHLFDIFQRIKKLGSDRILYEERLIVEHMHYRLGKSTKDSTYSDRNRFADDAPFHAMQKYRSNLALELHLHITKKNKIYCNKQFDFLPENFLNKFYFFTKSYLLNHKIDFKWRFYLWYWSTLREIFVKFSRLQIK